MEGAGIVIAGGVILVMIFGAMIGFSVGGKKRRKVILNLASTLGAEVRERPSLVLRWERGGQDYQLRFENGSVRLRVVSPDRTFETLKADSVDELEGILATERVKRNLDLIHRLDYSPGFKLEASRNRIEITKSSSLKEERSIRMFVNCAMPVVDRILNAGGAATIDVVEETSSDSGECQICGSDMADAVVRCILCDTPHHRSCWDYIGKCSTFGCDGMEAK